jgi:GDP-mannose 6-dehydrogenase
MRISVFGLGYVGAVSLACLARDGHHVVGVDVDLSKLDLLRSGRSPIVEEGIQELTKQVVDAGRVQLTNQAAAAIRDSELSFICVKTPSSANGAQDLTAVLRLAEQIGEAIKAHSSYHVIVLRSTVQPGTTEERFLPLIERVSGKKVGSDFGLCFQPEFLREGTSIKDYDNPPFTVIGSDGERSAAVVRQVFGHLPCDFIATTIRTAEALKMSCNAFHALKITFANEMGRICQSLDVDSHEVMALLCRDQRLNISPAYMRPGFAFGGSCLPKDLKALTYIAQSRDVQTPMLTSLLGSNRAHIDHAADAVLRHGRPRVGLLGLSFKPGTDDLRESPLVTLAKRLIGEGITLRVYDPGVRLSHLMGANRRFIEENIPHIASLMHQSLEEVVQTAEVIVLGHVPKAEVDRFISLCKSEQTVVDLANLSGRDRLRSRYWGVCW